MTDCVIVYDVAGVTVVGADVGVCVVDGIVVLLMLILMLLLTLLTFVLLV